MTESNASYTWAFAARVLLKAAALFALVNVVFALIDPLPTLGRVSIYNVLVPGRERLPYGVEPASYNLSPDSLDVMFAAHAVSAPHDADEYRVFVFGDSSTWGILLHQSETLVAQLNALNLNINGRRAHFYNLGYPQMSLTKDLLLLDEALQFEPDAIVWVVTLESFFLESQFSPPLIQRNPARTRALIEGYGLDDDSSGIVQPTFAERTLIGQRRALADWWRLQAFGWMWNATGIDQLIGDYTPVSNDLDADRDWKGIESAAGLTEADLAFGALIGGANRAEAANIPLFVVNEPIYRATGANSDLRYNVWYPRWAYDGYRGTLADVAAREGWRYADLWDVIPPEGFTDSPVHRTPDAERELATEVTAFVTTTLP
ncbi:MAG: hypothetical protein SGI73_03070 [Chloroflexota bacterium]|nr:hypothetical protein [Chloroflexota bacterium]